MTDVIMNELGTVDKYEGDAVMAFWGAPIDLKDHAARACRSALLQQKIIKDSKEEWESYDIPDFSVRIGINTGEAVVGNIGSNTRFNYTAIGDSVNLASRLEGTCKMYKVSIIISESTYKYVSSEFEVRELDKIRVKGKKEGVKIYELLSDVSSITLEQKEIQEKYSKALFLYQSKKFQEASVLFLELADNYKDATSQVMADRCIHLLNEKLDENWDGVYTMMTK